MIRQFLFRTILLFVLCPVFFSGCNSKPIINEAPYPTLHGQFSYFEEKNAQYLSFPIEKRDIVLIGDDLFDRGIWNAFYGSNRVKNRGIALEGTECTYYRVAPIAMQKPSKIFICTGLFDIKKGRSAKESAERIIGTAHRAKAISPFTKVYVVGIVPDRMIEKMSPETNALRDSIVKINTSLYEHFGKNYIDLPSLLTDKSGYLSREYTYDGVRINGKGYFVFADLLSPYIGLPALNNPALNDENLEKYLTVFGNKSAHYKARLSIFNSLPNTSGKVIMLGNSLNNNCWWEEVLQSDNVINRGISGDTVEGMLLRLNDIVDENPLRIYLMAGINDLIENRECEVEQLWNDYHELIIQIRKRLPDTELIVQSILPLNPVFPNDYYEGRNEKAELLNTLLCKNSSLLGYTYLDIASLLKDGEGNLDIKYTIDGVHLLPSAYQVWKSVINLD